MNKWQNYGITVSVAELCGILNKTKPTVLKLLQNGIIPATKFGGEWYISTENVKRFLREDV